MVFIGSGDDKIAGGDLFFIMFAGAALGFYILETSPEKGK